MTNNEDNFEWARRLECPTSATTDSIKKLLNQGIISLIWEELSVGLHPVEYTTNVRKNILLYKLKHGENDLSIQQVQSTVKIKEARRLLEPKIAKLEENCEENNFLARKKCQHLLKIKSQKHFLKIKEDILRLKLNELKTQIDDCKQMSSVCQHLMPATSYQTDENIINEILLLVSAISTRADKKMVLHRISESLSNIEISTLWKIILSKRIQDTKDLMELSTREITDTCYTNGTSMEISNVISCGEYVAANLQKQIHYAKYEEHAKVTLDHIEKIEALHTNISDLNEWLSLMLEVRMFETEQKFLEMEVDDLEKVLERQRLPADELANLEYEMRTIRTKMERCVHDIQKSLSLLKPACTIIARTREKLHEVMQKVVALRSKKQDVSYLNTDPSTELSVFHDTMQLKALRRIVLKDKVGVYRHTEYCMSEALRAIPAPSQINVASQFPMICAPIYQLLKCYKNLMMASWLMKIENESESNEDHDWSACAFPIMQDSSDRTLETLNATDLTCDRVREEIRQFNSILHSWKYQDVQKAMVLDDRVINGATYKEWAKRYEMLLHMVRRNK